MKIDKIPLNILYGVRQRMGVDETDNSKDSLIEHLSPYELMKKWCGWTFGMKAGRTRL